MVYLSILFASNKIPKEESKKLIEAIAQVLSKEGLHRGNVKIEKYIKRSGTRGNLPTKPSMLGVKARHFLEKECGHGCLRFYEELIDAKDDRTSGGRESYRKNKCSWRSLSSLFVLMDKEKFIEGDTTTFQKVVTDFIRAIKESRGERHMTHYMVCVLIFIPLVLSFVLIFTLHIIIVN
jgi:hypothetical protein